MLDVLFEYVESEHEREEIRYFLFENSPEVRLFSSIFDDFLLVQHSDVGNKLQKLMLIRDLFSQLLPANPLLFLSFFDSTNHKMLLLFV
jgi:hypothetical protein